MSRNYFFEAGPISSQQKDRRKSTGFSGEFAFFTHMCHWNGTWTMLTKQEVIKVRKKIYSFSKKYEPLRSSQILKSKNLVDEVIRALDEEYFNPFSVLVVDERFFNLSSGIPVNNLLADEVLQAEVLGKKLALAFATKRLVENGARRFLEALPKTKAFIQKYCKVCNCTKE